MKKWLALSMMMFLFTIAVHGATIAVTQPQAGNVTMGSPIQIAWTASGVTANVKILLRKPGGALVGTIANNLPVSPGPYTWTVAAPAVAGESYKIHVRAVDGSAEGASAAFTVVQGADPDPVPGSISNVKLSGNSPYCLGTNYTVSWTVSNVAQHLKLELLKDGAVNSIIAPDMVPGTSSKNWTAAGAAASDYKVRVSAMGAPATGESALFELKTCGGTGGLNPGDFHMGAKRNLKKLHQGLNGLPVEALPVVLPGVYKNIPCHETFPSNITPPVPMSVLHPGWEQISHSDNGANKTAQVGIYWFPYENYNVAAIYRSRIIFYLSAYAGQGAKLESAKLKMKRTHSIHEDANSGCGCSENLWVLKAPMTNYVIPAIGSRIDIDMGATEFTRDVTAIVKQWLDGTVVNNGLLLLAGELPCSGNRKCASCYEASLLLYMK